MKQNRAVDRLKEFARYAKDELEMVKGQNSFESYCGISNGYISNLDKSTKGSIGSDIIAKIMDKFPMLDIGWLCSGKGSMIVQDHAYAKKIEEIKEILK